MNSRTQFRGLHKEHKVLGYVLRYISTILGVYSTVHSTILLLRGPVRHGTRHLKMLVDGGEQTFKINLNRLSEANRLTR